MRAGRPLPLLLQRIGTVQWPHKSTREAARVLNRTRQSCRVRSDYTSEVYAKGGGWARHIAGAGSETPARVIACERTGGRRLSDCAERLHAIGRNLCDALACGPMHDVFRSSQRDMHGRLDRRPISRQRRA